MSAAGGTAGLIRAGRPLKTPRVPKGEKRPADVNGNAVKVMQIATGEIEEKLPKALCRRRAGQQGRQHLDQPGIDHHPPAADPLFAFLPPLIDGKRSSSQRRCIPHRRTVGHDLRCGGHHPRLVSDDCNGFRYRGSSGGLGGPAQGVARGVTFRRQSAFRKPRSGC
jgi:hypothetical protein